MKTEERLYKNALAYLVGAAIGDGNLSNPNGRAVRLRITCDSKYPKIIENVTSTLSLLFPLNKVGLIHRKDHCIDVSCYSNTLEELLGWKASCGSKYQQGVSVPTWIKDDEEFTRYCLKGLFETDGSVYMDRGYLMVNFVTIIPVLSRDVSDMISRLGFESNVQMHHPKSGEKKYTIRVSKRSGEFVQMVNIEKC